MHLTIVKLIRFWLFEGRFREYILGETIIIWQETLVQQRQRSIRESYLTKKSERK